ncbi:hypothetical protein WAF17_05650 [Bernardetia sp. ABR2-2B]|uniref:hypothetical protein n=1 Tax=Bernardetia sp. ABR2-2B TaxID=3127472 RepID=UPI0030CD1925
MKIQKTASFNLKSILYLFLFGIILYFSAFSCEVYQPLEIKIENQTDYDLKDIKIDDVHIASLTRGETSAYIATTDFEPLKTVSATINRKFEEEVKSFGVDSGLWCGTGMEDYPTKQSGKHSFVITSYQNDFDGKIRLRFEEK